MVAVNFVIVQNALLSVMCYIRIYDDTKNNNNVFFVSSYIRL